MDNTIAKGIIKAVVALAAVVLFLLFIYAIRIVFIYVSIAAVIAVIGGPLVSFLTGRMKFPNTLAVVLTMASFILILAGILYLLIPLIPQQAENLSLLSEEKFKYNLERQIQAVSEHLKRYKLDLTQDLLNIERIMDTIGSYLPRFFNDFVGIISNTLIGFASVSFISFFLLKDRFLLRKMIFSIVPDKEEVHFGNVIDKTNHLLSRYFIGLILQITLLFTIYIIILVSFGIGNAIIIAFICALLNVIPYVGPFIGGVLITFLTMSNFIGEGMEFNHDVVPKTMYVLIFYMLAQVIDNFISQPLIFSNSVKCHALEIFIVILIGGSLFGAVGMILAVPAYTTLRVILKEFFGEHKFVRSITKNI